MQQLNKYHRLNGQIQHKIEFGIIIVVHMRLHKCQSTTVLFEFSFEKVIKNVSMEVSDYIILSSPLSFAIPMDGPTLNEKQQELYVNLVMY